jgi:branched-chain amino acid transport system permease protein
MTNLAEAEASQTPKVELPSSRRPRAASGILIALLVVVLALMADGPSLLGEANETLWATMFTLMAMAQAWNLLGGYCGQFSIGHGLFVGLGGYVTTMLLLHTGLPLAAAIVGAAVVSAVIAGITAIPLLRLRGVYFSVGTIGLLLAVQAWFTNWGYAGQTTGVVMPEQGTLGFSTQYYMAAGLVVLTTVLVWAAVRSRFGRQLMAVRDDEEAAAELGVNGFRIKLIAMVLSAVLVGLAGSMNAFQQLTLEPYSAFSISWAINMILACVIGGLATLPGPLIGAALMFELQQRLQSTSDLAPLIEGVILLIVIRFAPGGIWGLLCRLVTDLRDRVLTVRSG